ncbi:allantoate transporter [Kwoniella heveanensis CBS 569]|uniref:Allantoate transporter n=1 Tax=Kwoniella heveanensis BCC8398 TaxID=1296120 RepID=A0A1B9GS97_9TREE|nr:allantoate transporter [Kwoniella heveanensis BCC8398]OCF39130.1 allantoate transporter [Kwoniella heveanensis CBS 569]
MSLEPKITPTHLEDEKLGADHIEVAHQLDPESGADRTKKGANNQLDDAARLLAEAGGHVEYTYEDSRRILRKIDLFVCLPMCLTYFIQQLDKSSVSYSAVFGLQKETGLVGTQYSWLSSIVYVAQLVCQPLSSYALIVFPVKYWVMFNMVSWSIVTACTCLGKNFTGLLICRLFLGIFEATILPSFVLITQMWWLRREQSYRTIAYQIANSFAAIFGPLLSYGIGKATEKSNAIKPYQGIFLFMGCFSLALVPLVWFLLPNSPTSAKFLRHGNDRLIAIDRLKENNTGTKSSKFKWNQVWETYKDPKTYMWAAMWLCAAIPSGGIGAFGGLITKGFGFDTFTTILMQIPTGAIGITCLLLSIFITNRIKLRWPVLAVLCLFPIAGATALTQVNHKHTGGLMGSYYVAYVFSAIQPLLISWCNLNAAGTTKRVVTTATMFGALTIGNVIGPQVYLAREAPLYHTGLYVDIACWCILFILICSMGAYLKVLNKRQEARRVALGMPANLKDISIMGHAEAEAYRAELEEAMRASGYNRDLLNEKAFEDMTDFENPSFMYVL